MLTTPKSTPSSRAGFTHAELRSLLLGLSLQPGTRLGVGVCYWWPCMPNTRVYWQTMLVSSFAIGRFELTETSEPQGLFEKCKGYCLLYLNLQMTSLFRVHSILRMPCMCIAYCASAPALGAGAFGGRKGE